MLCSMQPSTLLYVFSVAWRISSILCSANKIDSLCSWYSYLVNPYTWAIFISLKFICVHSEITGEIPNTSSRAGSKPGILSFTFMGAFREQIKLEGNWSNKNLFSVFHVPKFGYKNRTTFHSALWVTYNEVSPFTTTLWQMLCYYCSWEWLYKTSPLQKHSASIVRIRMNYAWNMRKEANVN